MSSSMIPTTPLEAGRDRARQQRRPLKWYAAIPPAVVAALLITAVGSVLVLAGSELASSQLAASQSKLWSLVDARVSLLKMQNDVLVAETAQRAYLITGEPAHLKPFERASDMSGFDHGVLLTKLGEFAALDKQAIEVGSLLRRKQEELALSMHLAQSGQRTQALSIMHGSQGHDLSTAIKESSDRLDQAILDQTRELTGERERLTRQQRLGVGALVMLNLAFLAALAGRTIKHFYEREIRHLSLADQAEQLERAVQQRTEELARLSTYLQEQSERERAQLARNLHDEFGALLTAAKADVSWLQGRDSGHDPQGTQRLERLSQELDQAVDLKRVVIENLRPALLDQLGLSAALCWHVEEQCKRAGLQWDFDVHDVHVEPPIALTLYRIAQEAMNNTVQHGHASRVWMTLRDAGPAIEMVLRDDGIGMNVPGQGQILHGIQNMRHRVSSHKGRLTIRSRPREGVELRVEIPKDGAVVEPQREAYAA